jgi:hypothetical protein
LPSVCRRGEQEHAKAYDKGRIQADDAKLLPDAKAMEKNVQMIMD